MYIIHFLFTAIIIFISYSTAFPMSFGLMKFHGNIETFESDLKSFEGKSFYVCFMSEWCPDCRAVPGIESALQETSILTSENIDLLVVNVGPRELWKSSDHPLRSHRLQIRGIPTLLHMSKDGVVERLETGLIDGSVYSQGGLEQVKAIVLNFADKQKLSSTFVTTSDR